MLTLLTLLTACNPQDATITGGHYFTWIAANSSTIHKDGLPDYFDQVEDAVATGSEIPEGPNIHIFECSGRGYDKYLNLWDEGYIGTTDDSNQEYITGGSCYCGEDDADFECGVGLTDENCPVISECGGVNGLEFHTFLQNDGYYLMNDAIAPWRTEALITGEGDLQLTVHHELPNSGEFRFHFTINPDFQPVLCTSDENSEGTVEYVDGSDWLSKWKEDEEGHTIYYLNAGAYQINPSDSEDFWYLDNELSAGFGMTRFGGEEFFSVPGFYGNYDNDTSAHFMYAQNRNDTDPALYDEDCPQGTEEAPCYMTQFNDNATKWAEEMSSIAGANVEGESKFAHKTEDNLWRSINSTNSGLDGWSEMHTSWVRISDDSEIEKGGTVKGDFQILYQALESNSRMVVTGQFEITDLKEDPWAYPEFELQKRDEHSTPYCDGQTL